MTSTLDEYLVTIRNQAEAKSRGVLAPPLELTGADSIVALDEIAAVQVETAGARLTNQWLAAASTRSIKANEAGTSLDLYEGETLTYSIPVDAVTGEATPDAETTSSLVADLA